MKSLVRCLLSVVVIAAWLAVCLLGAELLTRLSWRHVVNANPYVAARLGKGMWPGTEAVPPNPGDNAAGNTETIQAGPGIAAPREAREAWIRSVFGGLTPEERMMCTSALDKFVAVCDKRGIIEELYGTAIDGRFSSASIGRTLADTVNEGCAAPDAELMKAFEDAVSSGEMRSANVKRCDKPDESTYDAIASPLGDTNAAERRTSIWLPAQPHQDTASKTWDIPFVVYKLNAVGATTFTSSAEFHTNNVGFRDDDVILPKPAGVFRIACIGGSTTEEGDTNRKTYPNLMEDRLNGETREKRIDVVNCGISGITSLMEWMRFRDYLQLEPDLIVYYDGVNDLCHWLFRNWVFNATPTQKRLRESQFLCYYFNKWLLPSRAEMEQAIDSRTMKNVRSMCEAAEAAGVKIALCSFAHPTLETLPRAQRNYFEYDMRQNWGGMYVTMSTYVMAIEILNEKIRKLCEEKGLLYIPVAENVCGGTEYFGDICHMRNSGIEKKAEVIAKGLESLLPK